MASADVSAIYGIEIDVEGVDESLSAADALEKLRDKIGESTAALGAMQKALRGVQGGTAVDIQAFRTLRAAIAAKRQEIAQANVQLVKMKGAFEGLGPAAKKAQAAAEQVAFKTLKQELFGSEKAFLGLRLSTLKAVPVYAALGAAAVALSVALGAAAAAVVHFGVVSADARRNEQIDIQAAGTRLWYGYGGAVRFAADETEAGAKAISGALDRVSNSTTVGRERVAGFAKELEAAGLRGQDLETSLKAVSTAASVGKEAGLVGLFASLRFAGRGVDDLAARVQSKLGPLVERKLLSLDSQFQRLRENFALLFKNVNVEPILRALDKILGLFSQTKAVGYSLRIALEALFPTASAKTFGEVAVQIFKQVVIAGLRATVGLLGIELGFIRLRKWVDTTFHVDSIKAYAAVLTQIADTVARMVPGFQAIRDALNPENAAGNALGTSIGEGIRDGVNGSAPGVLGAIEGLAKGAIDKFRDKIESHSPSRLFFRAGVDVAKGAAGGIRDGAPDVDAAASNLVRPPQAEGEPTRAARRAVTINVYVGDVNAGGGKGQDMTELETRVEDMFERAAQKLAAAIEAA